jgi:hypothetical protein
LRCAQASISWRSVGRLLRHAGRSSPPPLEASDARNGPAWNGRTFSCRMRLRERERLHQLSLARLGSQGSIAERLEAQLSTLARTYELQRAAILADTRLSDLQRSNELLRLDLARQREESSLRSLALVEQEAAAMDMKRIRSQLAGAAESILTGSASASQMGLRLHPRREHRRGANACPWAGDRNELGRAPWRAHRRQGERRWRTASWRQLQAIERAQRADHDRHHATQTHRAPQSGSQVHQHAGGFHHAAVFPGGWSAPQSGASAIGPVNVNVTFNGAKMTEGEMQRLVTRAVDDSLFAAARGLTNGRRSGARVIHRE